MDPHRKYWNEQQQILQKALAGAGEHQTAIELFLSQHALVHARRMANSALWSFEDEAWEETDEEMVRQIPRGEEHSMVWTLWHLARIEDVTMNLLVAGSPQLLHRDGWLERLKVKACDTGNATDTAGVVEISATLDVAVLRDYRVAVGRRTRAIVQGLTPHALQKKVAPDRIQRITEEGAVVAAAQEVIDYWSKRTVAGLLLMPPTRHNFIHLNEALRLKQKLVGSRKTVKH